MNPTESMSSPRSCPVCGTPLLADTPEGLCPSCLLKAGIATQAPPPADSPTLQQPGSSTSKGPKSPSVAEVAQLFPQLEILELLGAGGMGSVYKARQPQLDRFVALKLMRAELSRDPAFAERFAREARALAKLNHPNIVSVFDSGQSGGFCHITMEFVDGTNLRSVMRAGKMTPREALGIVPKICDALQYAHDEGIVHRDIKPENILLDTRGRVKIADFGLAKLVGKDAADFSLTATGMTLGTPRYMAPEQFDNPQEVDHRADIYSLGVVLYEMLTGEVPMGRFSLPSATVGVDVRLDEVVLRSLEKEPSRRYQHASEVKTQVENISGVLASLPATMRHAFGFDYKSKRQLCGLPLVHICSGIDPVTGEGRRAHGILAIGDRARGVVALGGMATGIFAFGGMAVGVFAVGGLAFGAVTFGGLALALLVGYGGVCIAPVAVGGMAVGYYACGGGAFGAHILAGNGQDPEGRRFFEWLFSHLGGGWGRLNALALLLGFGSTALSFGAMAWAGRKVARTQAAAGSPPPRSGPPPTGAGSGAPSSPVRQGSAADTDPLAKQVRNPAIGLLITGLLYWITIPLGFVVMMQQPGGTSPLSLNLLLSFGLVPMIAGTVLFLAGGQMKRLESYGFVVAASLLPMLILGFKIVGLTAKTLAIGPGDMIGGPMGLWALAVLLRSDVRDAFARTRRGRSQIQSSGGLHASPRGGASDKRSKLWAWVLWLIVPIMLLGMTGQFKGITSLVPEPWGSVLSSVVVLGCMVYLICYFSTNRSEPADVPPASPPTPSAGAAADAMRTPPVPRFSRKAIWGAVWAPMFFIVAMMMFWSLQVRTSGPPEPDSIATEIQRDVRVEKSGAESKQATPDTEPPGDAGKGVVGAVVEMSLWQKALLILLSAIGLGSPIGTTVLGLVAIKDIRHSMGRIVGLPLALADALLYPLLILDAIIILVPVWVCMAFFGSSAMPPIEQLRVLPSSVLPVVVLVSMLVALALDILIVWLSWRAVKQPVTAA